MNLECRRHCDWVSRSTTRWPKNCCFNNELAQNHTRANKHPAAGECGELFFWVARRQNSDRAGGPSKFRGGVADGGGTITPTLPWPSVFHLGPTLTLDSAARHRVKGQIPAPRPTTRLSIECSTSTEYHLTTFPLDSSQQSAPARSSHSLELRPITSRDTRLFNQFIGRLARPLANASYEQNAPFCLQLGVWYHRTPVSSDGVFPGVNDGPNSRSVCVF